MLHKEFKDKIVNSKNNNLNSSQISILFSDIDEFYELYLKSHGSTSVLCISTQGGHELNITKTPREVTLYNGIQAEVCEEDLITWSLHWKHNIDWELFTASFKI